MRKHKQGPDFERLYSTLAATNDLPRFTYMLNPNSGSVSSTISSTLTLTNPSGVFPVRVAPGTDLIAVSGWSGITQSPKAITPVAPSEGNWGAAMVDSSLGTILKLFVTDEVEVGPLKSVSFVLNGIALDNVVGAAQLGVMEFVGGTQTTPPAIAFAKLGASMQIFAWSDVNSVGAGESTNINWTIVKGLYVTVIPPDDGTQYPRSGVGPYTAQTSRMPFQDAPQTIFTATVFQPPDTPIPFSVPLILSPPRITRFEPRNLPPIGIDDVVPLSWRVAYSPQVTLQPAKGSKYVGNEGKLSVKPRQFLAANDSSVTFVLTADGYKGPATDTLTVPFQPMRIAWFRYSGFDQKNSYTSSVPNAATFDVSQRGPTYFALNATGPGGPLRQELGGKGMEIQVAVTDPATPKAGEDAKLQYLVQGVTSLALQPGNQPLTFDANGRGETTIRPTASTTYTLVATDANGTTVSSDVVVNVTASRKRVRPLSAAKSRLRRTSRR